MTNVTAQKKRWTRRAPIDPPVTPMNPAADEMTMTTATAARARSRAVPRAADGVLRARANVLRAHGALVVGKLADARLNRGGIVAFRSTSRDAFTPANDAVK